MHRVQAMLSPWGEGSWDVGLAWRDPITWPCMKRNAFLFSFSKPFCTWISEPFVVAFVDEEGENFLIILAAGHVKHQNKETHWHGLSHGSILPTAINKVYITFCTRP